MNQPRIAIVTGAARGIGAATAIRLAEDGHVVAVLDLNPEHCSGTVEAIADRGGESRAIGVDVSDERSVAEAIEAVVSVSSTKSLTPDQHPRWIPGGP
jgi:3-oxoacyl-[acyl-carrier protein] reductase